LTAIKLSKRRRRHSVIATGANSRGQIVGWAENSVYAATCVPPQQLAFIWQNGVMTDLNTLKPASYPARLEQAMDINEAGEIARRSLDSFGVRRAFLATPAH
jgi:probable HAF family extracellular repeat protein